MLLAFAALLGLAFQAPDVTRPPAPPAPAEWVALPVVTRREGFGGFMTFMAVELRVTFDVQPPAIVTTTEETAYAIKTPSGIPLTLVTSVVDADEDLVRVRILTNATGSRGNVRGQTLDDVTIALGSTARTTRLGENFEVTVLRIGGRQPR